MLAFRLPSEYDYDQVSELEQEHYNGKSKRDEDWPKQEILHMDYYPVRGCCRKRTLHRGVIVFAAKMVECKPSTSSGSKTQAADY
jgi:hypothetical protein